ncbi:MAG: aminotransferase class I/II-fold pyridoxal phosphate-dependent enzyme [Candidatus Bathyarchaeota archaeon]|nr:aminotransferase class I/II-fold pyridoxal phosphate-dependent enzyme [Candidatus Bathyarchaeota archaeon]
MVVHIKVTKRAKSVEYAIRDVVVSAGSFATEGRKIFYLNIGDPVAFDFPTPPHIKQALCDAIQSEKNYYAPSEGLPELRRAIAEKEKRVNGIDITAENVLVTAGVSEGIRMVISALIEKGDEILVPGPAYPPYISYAKAYYGKPVTYETVEEENWQPNIDDLRKKISKKTRAIVIINPNNPTGALYRKKVVKEILDIAGEHDLLVLSDEIYDQIRYVEEYESTARLAKDIPVVGLNGFSKVYLMTGWRLGYIYFHDQNGELQELKESIEKEQRIRICANTPVQVAGVAALKGPQDHIKDLVERLRVRRDYALKRLNEIEGVSCAKPDGAFYVFPKIHGVGARWKTDMEFAIELLKATGVLLVHGSGFDPAYGAGHVRIVFLPPIETLEQAFNEIERFVKS